MKELQIKFVRNEWGFIESWDADTNEFRGFVFAFGDDVETGIKYENIVRERIRNEKSEKS